MLNGYLTVDANRSEVNERVATMAANYPDLCRAFPLPNLTRKGRQSMVLRIRTTQVNPMRRGVLFTAGLHGDEFGSEVVINFAEELLAAYSSSSPLLFGNANFAADDVQRILDWVDLFLVPLVNIDGRVANTRQNGDGVDLARNFPFLWDETNTSGSGQKGDRHYRGPAAGSEPETQNYTWLVDSYRMIGRIVDIHTNTDSGPIIGWHWGHDDSQSTDPSMSFTQLKKNPQWHTYIGYRNINDVYGDAYQEYIPPKDLAIAKTVADNMRQAVKNATGADYPALPAVEWSDSETGVSGTPTDYLYSRHFLPVPFYQRVYPTIRKVLQYVASTLRIPWVAWLYSPSPYPLCWLIEYGQARSGNNLNPGWPTMAGYINEVNAAMTQCCLDAVDVI